MTDYQRNYTVLAIRYSSGAWCVMTLEAWVLAEGPSFLKALSNLQHQFAVLLEYERDKGIEPFSNLCPAPDKYWKKAKKAVELSDFSAMRQRSDSEAEAFAVLPPFMINELIANPAHAYG